MDQKSHRFYPSKILVFGEYLVLKGGTALAFPCNDFRLNKGNFISKANKIFFRKIDAYIKSKPDLSSKLNPNFLADIDKGLNYNTNIPIGYGLGSSGALVAAIYDEYFQNKETDLLKLKNELADIESFFHEKSSGIDPLTSYLQSAIFSQDNDIELVSVDSLGNFSLYDSGLKRNAREAILHFMFLCQDASFEIELMDLKEISDVMIHKWLCKEDITSQMKEYSVLQLTLFKDFIPPNVKQEWEKGLSDNQYYMKLCGAGMGGMFLKYSLSE